MRQARTRMPLREWEVKSRAIQKILLGLDCYRKAGALLTYLHFDREVKTDLIIETALQDKKIVCLPANNWQDCTITAGRIFSLQDVDVSHSVPEPKVLHRFPVERIELVIVPGVVFDTSGDRIGMGKGFFDKFLVDLPGTARKIGLAFEFQIVREKIPVQPWDVKVDLVITEKTQYGLLAA